MYPAICPCLMALIGHVGDDLGLTITGPLFNW
jgi:hypothetical protein